MQPLAEIQKKKNQENKTKTHKWDSCVTFWRQWQCNYVYYKLKMMTKWVSQILLFEISWNSKEIQRISQTLPAFATTLMIYFNNAPLWNTNLSKVHPWLNHCLYQMNKQRKFLNLWNFNLFSPANMMQLHVRNISHDTEKMAVSICLLSIVGKIRRIRGRYIN